MSERRSTLLAVCGVITLLACAVGSLAWGQHLTADLVVTVDVSKAPAGDRQREGRRVTVYWFDGSQQRSKTATTDSEGVAHLKIPRIGRSETMWTAVGRGSSCWCRSVRVPLSQRMGETTISYGGENPRSASHSHTLETDRRAGREHVEHHRYD